MQYMTREERLLKVSSIKNIRDLGGYETQEGYFTKAHKYIRSATPAKLTQEDLDYIKNYGVKVSIDLRGAYEVSMAPSVFEDDEDVKYIHIDLFNDPNSNLVPSQMTDFKDMGDLYILILDHLQAQIYKVFKVFLDYPYDGILFHCSAGKDRTGVISALLLDLAGCHEYDIVKDYSESYENNQEIYEELLKLAPSEDQKYLLSQPLYMMKMLNHLRENYGSAKNYLIEIGFSEEEVEELKNIIIF